MSRFDERKLRCMDTCEICKHCYMYETYYDWAEEIVEEHFCMLDVSDDDLDYLCESEIDFKDKAEYTPRFLEIMRLKEGEDLSNSPRITSAVNNCQFFDSLNKQKETGGNSSSQGQFYFG